jgi:BirA family biotin operon repressor/biotin-[acetyl-CoA-carboxylase] ligase
MNAEPASPAVLPGLSTRALGRAVHAYDIVGSTNEELWSWAAEGAPHGAVCVAAAQSRGRGRQGRSWHSPAGAGLYASLLVRPDTTLERMPAFSAVVALIAAQAAGALADCRPLLKWPNDLWIGARKLGGVLLEGRRVPEGAVVIGLGINLRTPPGGWPPGLPVAATSLAQEGHDVEALGLLAAIVNRLEPAYDRFLREGFAPFRESWSERSLLDGRRVRVVEGERAYTATAQGVDTEGRLAVRLPDGSVRQLLAGEVHLSEVGAP